MPDRKQCEFFLLRYVPDAVKNEFVNLGVVLLQDDVSFADVRFARDLRRVRCLDPTVDLELLERLENDLKARLAGVKGDREKLIATLRDSFSNTIQVSETTALLAESPAEEIERLAELYLETRRPRGERAPSRRQQIFHRMRDAFDQAGVWALMRHDIRVAQYTHPGDPLKLDCGYRPNGEVKLFHAVSLSTEPDTAKVLAFSFPAIAAGILKQEQAETALTAVVEDDLDRVDDEVAFALRTFADARIAVSPATDLPDIASGIRRDLRL